ncbi:MAG: gliding motility-associated C-terminal domain-containing protein [Bacteroidetes bacterium]|nr:gliding motility-associated C-terminal domain-containing protein [Bacteroidota bacterium]
MKKLFTLLFIIFSFLNSFSQGVDCASADPFCTGTTYTFPNSTSTTSQTGPDYGCLITQPNPAWYFMQIANSGNLSIDISQSTTASSGIDVDFICYGPFATLAGACNNLTAANTVDCSFSTAAVEQCNIPSAVTGQFYLLLLTNYSGQAGNITFNQGGGTGTTDCSIMAPPITNNGPLCVGQTLNLTVSSPVAGATYSWTGPGGFVSATMNPTRPSVTLAMAGVYSLVITVGGVSSPPVTTTVIVNPNPTVTVNSPTICAGDIATLTANGATNYEWDNGSTLNPISGALSTTTSYTVTGTSLGCTGTAVSTVTVNPLPVPTVTIVNASCGLNNGTATANPAGQGYLWNTTAVTQAITGLGAGVYTVTVTDGNGCSATSSGTVINIPGGLATADSTDEHCGHSDGTATANMVGAVSYAWSNLGNTQTITGLTAGTYSVTVTNGIGCTATASVVVNNVAGPSVPFTNVIDETCSQSNGSITAAPANGVGPYTYDWSTVPVLHTVTISNLPAGTYSVTVTDANSCVATNSVSIINSPPPVGSVVSVTDENCGQTDGAVTIQYVGGTGPMTFLWSNNAVSQNITNVTNGNYSVTITDLNGCKDTVTATVGLIGGPSATVTTVEAACDQPNGSASVLAQNGSGVYTYLWSNTATTSTISNLLPGTYSVVVDDGVCSITVNGTVGNIPGPNAEFTASPSIMTIDDPNCTFTDNSTNTTTWAWNFGDGSTSSMISPSHSYESTGTYLVTLVVANNSGCLDSTQHTVIVKGVYTFYIPNSFSPNGDGINDFFNSTGTYIDMSSFELYVYDRWGKEMYSSKNISRPWNGTFKNTGNYEKAHMGVYVYKILIKDLDGYKHEYNGPVTIVK